MEDEFSIAISDRLNKRFCWYTLSRMDVSSTKGCSWPSLHHRLTAYRYQACDAVIAMSYAGRRKQTRPAATARQFSDTDAGTTAFTDTPILRATGDRGQGWVFVYH